MRHILSWVDIENHTHSNSPIHIVQRGQKRNFRVSGEPLFVGIEVKKCTYKQIKFYFNKFSCIFSKLLPMMSTNKFPPNSLMTPSKKDSQRELEITRIVGMPILMISKQCFCTQYEQTDLNKIKSQNSNQRLSQHQRHTSSLQNHQSFNS